MVKSSGKKSNQGPISKKVLAGLRKINTRKVIDLSEFKEAKIYSENLEKEIISQKDLSKHDPLHGIYIYAQNKLSVFAEQLGEIPALSKLTNAYADAEDLYLPSGPPMSPLTASYFSCWGFLDLCVGLKKETFGTVIIDLCKSLEADPGLIQVFECMQKSRMGVYIHRGNSGGYVFLEELITGKQIKAIVPSGYAGKPDEIWFVRVLPEPFPELNFGYSVVFTTPYVMMEMNGGRLIPALKENWLSFFERNIEKTNIKDEIHAYEKLMKYGRNRLFWNEYIFEGYAGYQHEMIMLAGFPDIPLSRPHSEESEERMDFEI